MKKKLLLCSTLLLTACAQENDFSYLLNHPHELRKRVLACQSQIEKNASCTRILSIADRYDDIMNKAIQDQAELGNYILLTQEACVASKQAWIQAEQALANLRAKQAAPQEIRLAEKTAVDKKRAYEEKNEEIEIFYAIIGQNSPE